MLVQRLDAFQQTRMSFLKRLGLIENVLAVFFPNLSISLVFMSGNFVRAVVIPRGGSESKIEILLDSFQALLYDALEPRCRISDSTLQIGHYRYRHVWKECPVDNSPLHNILLSSISSES